MFLVELILDVCRDKLDYCGEEALRRWIAGCRLCGKL